MDSERRPEDRWLSTTALSERFDVPVRTIQAWREQGTGPAGVRIGKVVRYRLSEVERWEAERERAS